MRLILHAGSYKTGSSFLQTAFSAHQQALFDRGLHYPSSDTTPLAAKGRITAGNGVPLFRLLGDTGAGTAARLGEYLRLQAEAASGRNILLSSEALQNLSTASLSVLSEQARQHDYQLEVVLYARSIAGGAYSAYLQSIKRARETGDFTRFARAYSLPAANVLDKLEAVLPRERITIGNFDLSRNDLYRDFVLRVLDERFLDITVESGKEINRSISQSHVPYLLELNRHLSNDRQCTKAGYAFASRIEAGRKWIVTPEQAALLTEKAPRLARLNSYLRDAEALEVFGPEIEIGEYQLLPLTEAERASILLLRDLLKGAIPD